MCLYMCCIWTNDSTFLIKKVRGKSKCWWPRFILKINSNGNWRVETCTIYHFPLMGTANIYNTHSLKWPTEAGWWLLLWISGRRNSTYLSRLPHPLKGGPRKHGCQGPRLYRLSVGQEQHSSAASCSQEWWFWKPKAPSACPFKFSPVVYAEADAHRPTAARMFQITDLQMCQSTSSHDIPSTFS